MEPVDLLLVADSLEGGLGLAVAAQVRYFAAHGWRVALVAPTGSPPVDGAAPQIELPLPDTATDVRAVLRCARTLRVVRRDLRPRIVHAHGLRSQLIVVAGGHRPWITRHGGGRMAALPWHVSLARSLATPIAPLLAREALTVSPAAGRWHTILTASPNLRHLPASGPELMDPDPLFLWIGRLDAPKRPDIFVSAVAEVARTVRCRGVVIGSGPASTEVRMQVRDLGAPIDVIGHQEDLAPWFARAWAVCLFSEFEGLPFSVQEAMWSGRAVVASDLPGIRWFAGDDVTYASDVVEATSALRRLTDRDEAVRRGRVAATRVHGRVDADAPFPELERLYLAAGARPRGGDPARLGSS